jgi:glycosyltransferase involved in cell wall biosynthesis
MRHLARESHEVHLACAAGTPDAPTPTLSAAQEIPDLTVRPVNLGPELFARSALGRIRAAVETAPAVWNLAALALYIKKHGIQILHTSDRPRDALACALLARATGAQCVVHVHVTYGDWMSPMLRWSMARADALIGVSQFVARSLVKGGYAAGKTHAALNAIIPKDWDYRLDSSGVRAEFGIAPEALVMVCVARIFRSKGQLDLIRAMGMLRSEFPQLKLLVVGADYPLGTHHSQELRALAIEQGVADNVIFTGTRTDIARLIAASDMLAMPSFEEPFGLVFAEAMAMKRPVIALDNGGAPEVVDHEKTGLLSPYQDTAALAANIRRLAQDPVLRGTMGDNGRKQVELRFTPERLAGDVARIYATLVAAS